MTSWTLSPFQLFLGHWLGSSDHIQITVDILLDVICGCSPFIFFPSIVTSTPIKLLLLGKFIIQKSFTYQDVPSRVVGFVLLYSFVIAGYYLVAVSLPPFLPSSCLPFSSFSFFLHSFLPFIFSLLSLLPSSFCISFFLLNFLLPSFLSPSLPFPPPLSLSLPVLKQSFCITQATWGGILPI